MVIRELERGARGSRPDSDDELVELGRVLSAFTKLETEVRGWRQSTTSEVSVWATTVTQLHREAKLLREDVDTLLALTRGNQRSIKVAGAVSPLLIGVLELVRLVVAFYSSGGH